MNNEKLFLTEEDLYRVGNSSSPQLTKLRIGEITIVDLDGIKVIIADGKGISLYNESGLKKSSLTGWIWELNKGTVLPLGLYLQKDPDPNNEGHYFVCPMQNMPVNAYVGLLEQMAMHCNKIYRKTTA